MFNCVDIDYKMNTSFLQVYKCVRKFKNKPFQIQFEMYYYLIIPYLIIFFFIINSPI